MRKFTGGLFTYIDRHGTEAIIQVQHDLDDALDGREFPEQKMHRVNPKMVTVPGIPDHAVRWTIGAQRYRDYVLAMEG